MEGEASRKDLFLGIMTLQLLTKSSRTPTATDFV